MKPPASHCHFEQDYVSLSDDIMDGSPALMLDDTSEANSAVKCGVVEKATGFGSPLARAQPGVNLDISDKRSVRNKRHFSYNSKFFKDKG